MNHSFTSERTALSISEGTWVLEFSFKTGQVKVLGEVDAALCASFTRSIFLQPPGTLVEPSSPHDGRRSVAQHQLKSFLSHVHFLASLVHASKSVPKAEQPNRFIFSYSMS